MNFYFVHPVWQQYYQAVLHQQASHPYILSPLHQSDPMAFIIPFDSQYQMPQKVQIRGQTQPDMKAEDIIKLEQPEERQNLELQGVQREEKFEAKKSTDLPLKRYPKKNTETNIISQISSFLAYPRKSTQELRKIYPGQPKKIQIFYAYMKTINSKRNKYLNFEYLMRLMKLPQGSPQSQLVSRSRYRLQILPVQEFRRGVRRLVMHYLKSKAVETFVHTKKLNDQTIRAHLSKRRQLQRRIHDTLNDQLRQKDANDLNQ